MEKKDIINGLDNILMLYAGKTKSFNQNAKDLIQGSGKRNVFQKVIVNSNIYQKYLVSGNFTPVETYHAYLQKIKEHNPKGYNKFLRELYKTINEVKVNTNNTNNPSTTEEG
jgi:malonyl CoA-acyl carrier protein transacylase